MQLPPQNWSDWNFRIEDEHAARWLTRAARDVALAIGRLSLAGEAAPTVAQIAVAAKCSPSSVKRARAVMRERGLLATEARFALVDDRPQQRASENRLLLPVTPVTPKPPPVRGGQTDRPISRKEASKPAHEQARPPAETLAAIARRREVALGLAW
jgi:hypothetical protein